MRLHRLEITAFGPFAETAEVDFDALSESGLFLLSGATGAGKTSVLDAVCFALYGAVPGERNDAKRLRSDQAAAGVAPRVLLEATLAGRRFRIVRSPSWARPKRRGQGTTLQQASVVISERLDSSWVTLSTRLDETGQLVTGLVGMNLTQFTQVALLPQGRFQAFLRATSEERHRLLQQLFHTGRFEQVEHWLRDRRLSLLRRHQDHEAEIVALLHRVSEAGAVPMPSLDDVGADTGAGDPRSWCACVVLSTRDRWEATRLTLPAREEAERQAQDELTAARDAAALLARHAAAEVEHARLLSRDHEMTALRGSVDAAIRALPLLPLLTARTRAEAALDQVRARHARAREEAGRVLGSASIPMEELDEERCARLLGETIERMAAVRAVLPRETERADLQARVTDARRDIEELCKEVAAWTAVAAEAPARLERLRADLDAARTAAAARPGLRDQVAQARARLDAGTALVDLRNNLVAAQLELNAAVAVCLTLSEDLLALQQARLDGMAAEIASGLAVGACCPVCGSAEHPQPARPASGAPDAAAERELRRRLDDAEFERHTRAERARDLQTQASVAEHAAGTDDLVALEAALSEAAATLAEAEAAASGEAAAVEALSRATSEIEEASRSLAEATERLAGLRSTTVALESRLAEIVAELATVVPSPGTEGGLGAVLARLEQTKHALQDLAEATIELRAADRAAEDARQAVEQCAIDAGFEDGASARAALLSEDALAERRAALEEHRRRITAVTLVLEDPALADLARQTTTAAADELVAERQRAHAAAARMLSDTRAADAAHAAAMERLLVLERRLDEAVCAWLPVRRDLATVSDLSAFVEGKAPDNRLQMRLSAYVLGYRLSQVVDAANARLARMSDQRYSLEHTGRRGTGERRGGLSLLVRDDWSGETRDPATLSGGETFVVSLALALGLADVITDEVGGAALDTLFVDEGFGSLDSQTLDDVMDTLDSLRDGGRVVGVVSHVAEMRDRIHSQLVVEKARSGSTVRVRA